MIKKIKLLIHRAIDLLYYLRSLHIPNKTIEKNSIVFVMQDFQRQGSEVLAYNIVYELNNNGIHTVVISFRSGPMMDEFKKITRVFIRKPSAVDSLLKKLRFKYECKNAICNTVIAGKCIKSLYDNNYIIVSLIHELYNILIDYKDVCRDICQYSKRIVFPSEYGLKDYRRTVGTEFDNYVIQSQGLYLTGYEGYDKETCRKKIIEKHKLSSDSQIIINVATGCLRKGTDLFIDVAYQMEKSDPKISFIWIGDKTEKHYKDALRKYSCNEINNLIFTGYINDKSELYEYYYAADFLLLTSREEPYGSIVLEAFKAGTPVIAFEGCGGYMDVVKYKTTGFLIEPFSTSDIVKCIRDNIYSQEIGVMRQNCINLAETKRFDKYVKLIVSFFDERESYGQ